MLNECMSVYAVYEQVNMLFLLQDLPTIVCLVRASWLICMLSSSSCPSGSVCLSLKWSTSAGGFFQSTWIETSVWPRTRISSIAETSGKDTSVGQQGGTDISLKNGEACITATVIICPALLPHVLEQDRESLQPRYVTFLGWRPSRNFCLQHNICRFVLF